MAGCNVMVNFIIGLVELQGMPNKQNLPNEQDLFVKHGCPQGNSHNFEKRFSPTF